MKLLRIKVSNLNSLYGEHEVDLENGLGGAPLFLIVGPTGSGKSTLMDAVSLALFGQTPRLPRAKSDAEPEADSRNVISRGAGVASAQVELSKIENGRPVRYLASWSCQRARKSPEGKPQDPVRTLERLEDGKWVTLASDHREKFYRDAFARFLEGMTVEDFKRSMLLAQGEFSAFLKANEDERASILERLTDTAEYKALGVRAHKGWQEARRAYEMAGAALGEVKLLTEAEEAALRDESLGLAAAAEEKKGALSEIAAGLGWLERKGQLEAAVEAARGRELEAQGALEAARPNRVRLEAHERCAEAVLPLAELDRLGGERSRGREQLPALDEALQSLQARAAEAGAALSATGELRDGARRALEEEAPAIASARALRAELATAVRERDLADGALKAKRGEADAAQAGQKRCEEANTTAAQRVEQARIRLASVERARPLVEALAGLRERAQQLKARKADAGERAARLDSERAGRAALAKDLETLTARAGELAGALPALELAAKDAGARLAAALDGAAEVQARRAALRGASERLQTELSAVEELSRELEAKAQEGSELEALRERLAQREAQVAETTGRLQTLAAERASLEAKGAQWSTELEDQRWFQSVARERSRLKDGVECPLCGSAEHPALHDGRYAERDARIEARCQLLARALEENRTALDRVQRDQLAAEKGLAALQAETGELQARVGQLRGGLEAREAKIAAAAERWGWDLEAGVAGIRARIEAARAAHAGTERALDEADRLARAAQDALTQARTAWERAQASAEGTRARLEEKERSLGALEAEHGESALRDEALARELSESLAALGLSPADPEAALAHAGEQVRALREAEAGLSAALEAARAAEAALGAASARAVSATAALEEARQAASARGAAVATLEARCGEVLSGRDPDAVEKALKDALAAAEAGLDRARQAAEALERERTSAQTRLEQQKRRLEELEKAEAEARARLEAIARRLLGSGDLEAIRRALLPDEVLRALSAERTALMQALEGARAVLAARSSELQAHLLAVPAEAEQGAAALQARKAELEAALESLQQRIGELRVKLQAQADARRQLGEKQAAFEEARKTFETWERLNQLIGQGEGEAFKRFAQILNLSELIERANAHLERLAPRYRLTGATTPAGEARLAFAVKDAFQADTVRPVSTLSGGETFLVSLALALGLASYRTVRMPIETLLLDEGFGTLDPETLQVAMAALEALNASGTQVGIISHVEALKERVPARVVVERVGNGRSQVRLENG